MADPFTICNEITKKSASNLWFVSRSLSKRKHRLFVASYASMRVIDDFVDNDFLMRSIDMRHQTRSISLAKVEKWRQNAKACATADFCGDSDYPKIFEALNKTLSNSSLKAGPWMRLAGAMQFDINEKLLESWDDFLTYCIGATIAPAEVFLYILACKTDDEGHYAVDSALNFQELAYEMAIFCYLIHIMRDISKDGLQGGQLITIPEDMLLDCKVSRDDIQANLAALERLIAALITKADALLPILNEKELFLKSKLKGRERLILSSLLSIYRRLFDKIKACPQDFIAGNITGLDCRTPDDRTKIKAEKGC